MTEQSAAVKARDKQYFMPTFGDRYGIVLDHGEGVYVTDKDGKSYLDFLAGIAVNALGHAHPRMCTTITQQSHKLMHCSNLYYTEEQSLLVERLCQLSGFDKCFLTNSGAEANECALKLAKLYHYKKGNPGKRIISAVNSFHGRTIATTAATGQEKYFMPISPLPAEFMHIPFNDIAALENAIDDNAGCLLLEVIQGESGIHPLSSAYLQRARELCDQHDCLLIVDEIQSGMGRCGKFTACEVLGVKADIISMAKALGGGVPIGACLATESVAQAFAPGAHGTTFGGNPFASACALCVLDVMAEENLMARCAELGAYFKEKAAILAADKMPGLECRGHGLMLALEHPEMQANLRRQRLQDKGVLVNSIGDHILRILPPYIIERKHIDIFFEKLEETCDETPFKSC